MNIKLPIIEQSESWISVQLNVQIAIAPLAILEFRPSYLMYEPSIHLCGI